MSLTEYQHKRDFRRTSEPSGKQRAHSGWLYVIQKHDASHLHYDFRLQLGDVLKSWAVPKGPSLDPSVKRLAVHVEDHPVDYGDFEGIIPAGQYGGGTVLLWDRGDWTPVGDAEQDYKKGHLKFVLHGNKLQGEWSLIRKGGQRTPDEKTWFLIKGQDDYSSTDHDILSEEPRSVATDRTIEQIAGARDRVWNSKGHGANDSSSAKRPTAKRAAPSKAVKTQREDWTQTLTELSGAKKRRLPAKIDVQLATLVKSPPDTDDWLHEIKFDGYRIIAQIDDGSIRFMTRNHQDWTEKLGSLAESMKSLPVTQAILDGEIVVLDSDGISRFQQLQQIFKNGHVDSIRYFIFDLLYLNGYDLRSIPLEQRKELLSQLLSNCPPQGRLRFSDHVVGDGETFFAAAKKRHLEGIVSKQRNSVSVEGRSQSWVKSKCTQSAEFVIGGFTDPGGARAEFGAILIGYFDEQKHFVYAGKVGTGFSRKTLNELMTALRPLIVSKTAFTKLPAGSHKQTHWVKPQLVAQIEFSEWTADGRLRHPSYVGLREDKPASQVKRDVEIDPALLDASVDSAADSDAIEKSDPNVGKSIIKCQHQGATNGRSSTRRSKGGQEDKSPRKMPVKLTHPDKILYHDQGFSKRDLLNYYMAIAPWILPHIKDRLAVLVRCPDGIQGGSFYQKHPAAGTPESIRQIAVKEKESTGNYLVLDSVEDLAWTVQVAALELHVWGSRADDIELADRLIFDLDPDPSVEWPQLAQSARQIREFLKELKLESFLKTTGGKGLHVVVPIQRRSNWDEVKSFCHGVARAIEIADPKHYTSNMSKAARKGRIFIDYLRNQRGATAVAAYSTRAREGAPVSTPVRWDELDADIRADHFNIQTVPQRVSRFKRDPWEKFWQVRQSITAAAMKLVQQAVSN